MKTVYRVTGVDMNVTEDTFKNGEVGKSTMVLNERHNLTYDSLQALFDDMCKNYDLPKDKGSWCILEDGRLDCQFHVSQDWLRVDEERNPLMLRDWRWEKCKLWSAYFCVYVIKSAEEDLSLAEVKEFGIEEV